MGSFWFYFLGWVFLKRGTRFQFLPTTEATMTQYRFHTVPLRASGWVGQSLSVKESMWAYDVTVGT